jgi:hypothetical protein
VVTRPIEMINWTLRLTGNRFLKGFSMQDGDKNMTFT